MTSISVFIESKIGAKVACTLSYSCSPPWRIQLEYDELGNSIFEGEDLFLCLRELRKSLEEKQCRILCNGSRVDAYPSPMSRQMSGGRKVYILRKGQQTSLEDLVDIFASSDANSAGTVEEQQEFYLEWLESLK
jgi:hypothetical protein